MERIRAVCIIINEDKIALIRRVVRGKGEYYVFPGGGVEPGETPEHAVVREIKEELSLDVEVKDLLWEHKDEYHHGFYFLAKSVQGNLRLGNGPEMQEQSDSNVFDPRWIPLKQIAALRLYPEAIRDRVVEKFLSSKSPQ